MVYDMNLHEHTCVKHVITENVSMATRRVRKAIITAVLVTGQVSHFSLYWKY